MRLPPLLLVPLFTLGCGGDTPPPEGAYLHPGTFMSGHCFVTGGTIGASRSDTSREPPVWAEVTAIPHTLPTEPAWRVTTPCLDGTTGFDVTERGLILSYRGSITEQGRPRLVQSVAVSGGAAGYISDLNSAGELRGGMTVDVSDGARTERASFEFVAYR